MFAYKIISHLSFHYYLIHFCPYVHKIIFTDIMDIEDGTMRLLPLSKYSLGLMLHYTHHWRTVY